MMTQADSPDPGVPAESLYEGITSWAAHAGTRLLVILAFGGISAAALLPLSEPKKWPMLALLIAGGAVGAWGLVEHRAQRRRTPGLSALEWLLVGIGVAAAIVGGFGMLFWLMGPRPIL